MAILVVNGLFFAIQPAWAAAHGHGVIGTYTVTDHACSHDVHGRVSCRWLGAFRSNDGSDLLYDVEMAGGLPSDVTVGSSYPARDSGDKSDVYPPSGSRTWEVYAAVMLALCGYLIWYVIRYGPPLVRAFQRRREGLGALTRWSSSADGTRPLSQEKTPGFLAPLLVAVCFFGVAAGAVIEMHRRHVAAGFDVPVVMIILIIGLAFAWLTTGPMDPPPIAPEHDAVRLVDHDVVADLQPQRGAKSRRARRRK